MRPSAEGLSRDTPEIASLRLVCAHPCAQTVPRQALSTHGPAPRPVLVVYLRGDEEEDESTIAQSPATPRHAQARVANLCAGTSDTASTSRPTTRSEWR